MNENRTVGSQSAVADQRGEDAIVNHSPLSALLEATCRGEACSMKDLTVLATQNDPFRRDTPAGHRDGAWLANTARRLGLGNRTIHLRGLHYMVIDQPKPDGEPYTNTDKNWSWLQERAGKAARWLGYIPFEQIVDERNAEPSILIHGKPVPNPFISVGLSVDLPDADDLVPQIMIADFRGVQPYRLVLIGEKSSLEPVLGSIAARFGADLYLPTGEPSDTQLHTMAKVADEDGRRMIVFYFSDSDPSGWQMPISVGRKLQAFKVGFYPGLTFEVRRVALTPEQVRAYGLPSTPLKETERRASNWIAKTDTEQTEIDALAALRPELLSRLAEDAIRPFYDWTLNSRVLRARSDWIERAQAQLDRQLDANEVARIRDQAAQRLAEMREEIDTLNDSTQIDIGDLDLPPVEVPEPVNISLVGLPSPLIDSDESFAEQSRRLKAIKAEYEDELGKAQS